MRNQLRVGLALAATTLALAAMATSANAFVGQMHAIVSGQCVQAGQINGSAGFNGLPIFQAPCGNPGNLFDAQHWNLIPAGTAAVPGRSGAFNVYWLKNANSLQTQCLDLKDGSTAEHAPMQTWSCNTTSKTMKWMLGSSFGGGGGQEFVNVRSGKCLAVNTGSVNAGSLQQTTCTSTAAHPNASQLFVSPPAG